MRPYLAIIKDSFRAAMASRVLYVLLILITLLLVALAPAHVKETLDWRLRRSVNVKNPDQLIARLVERREKNKAVGRIWELLPESLREKLLARQSGDADQKKEPLRPGESEFSKDIQLQEDLLDELNTIIESKDFYREDDWAGRRGLNDEAKSLLKDGIDKLSEIRMKRLNRLLLTSALTPSIDSGNPTALELYYAIWKFPFPIQMTHQQFAQAMVTGLPYYFDKFVLSIGLFIAIIVTANMVPETFEPGSLNLLLSKPISRWGLYTAKFWGGCVFIGLCAVYLFFGLWLWLGLAMGVWDRAILLSIPLYIIVFAIYFSVSAFVGLLWRSPIVSVILTLLFWVACFSVGTLYGFSKIRMNNDEMLAIVPARDKVLAIDLMHQINVWDQNKNSWSRKHEIKLEGESAMIIGTVGYLASMRDDADLPTFKDFIKPFFDPRTNRVLTSQLEMPFPSGNKPLFVSDEKGENYKKIGNFPPESLKAWSTTDGVVVVTGAGKFFQLNQQKFDEALKQLQQPEPTDTDSESEKVKPSKGKSKKTNAELFDPIGPNEATEISSRNVVDYSIARNEFVIYSKDGIRIFNKQNTDFQLKEKIEVKLDFDAGMTTLLASGRDKLVLAFGNGRVKVIDIIKGVETDEFQLERRTGVREVFSSPDGKFFAIQYRNGNLWTWNTETEPKFVLNSFTGQGEVSSFGFGENGKCWIGYDSDRVIAFDLAAKTREARYAPSGNFLAQAYRYCIRPLYRVFPKPGEFYKVVTHLASAGDTSANQTLYLNKSVEAADPWGPLWSGLFFMFGMLVLGCVVFHFRDY